MKFGRGLGRAMKVGVLYVGLPVALLVGIAAFVLIRTQPGLDWLLRQTVSSVSSSLAGDVRVSGIRTDGLLRGLTLHDVRVADEQGRPFVTADSIRVGYSLSDILRREIVLVPMEVWRPSVVVERLHGDERSNAARIFAPDGPVEDPLDSTEEAADPESAPWSLELRSTRLYEGSFVLRQPAEPDLDGEGALVEHLDGAGAGSYRIIRLENIDARLSSADILGRGGDGMEFEIEALSLDGWIRPRPFRVVGMDGTLLVQDAGLSARIDRLVLPGSELAGDLDLDWAGESLRFATDLNLPAIDLADLSWLVEDLPAATGSLELSGGGTTEQSQWRAENLDLATARSRVSGRVGVELDSGLRLTDTALEFAPLAVLDVTEWLDDPTELEGEIRGTASASGPLRDLRVDAEVVFSDPSTEIPPTTATIQGWVDVDGAFGARDLTVRLDSLQYASLSAFAPDLAVRGTGSAVVDATGTLDDGIQVTGQISHAFEDEGESRVSFSGLIEPGEDTGLDLVLTLDPLSFDGLAAGLDATWPVSGNVSGSATARGTFSDMAMSGTFATVGGSLDASATLDLGDPFRSYRVEASVRDFALHEVISGAADPTVVTAEISVDGSGGTLETLEGTGVLVLSSSNYGAAEIDSARVMLRATGGRLQIEDLEVSSPLLAVQGSGDLALRDDEPDGRLALRFEMESLASLRPMVFGDEVIAADTLTQLEREILRLDGIDPDTLTDAEVIPLEGRVSGELTVRGAVNDFEGDGLVEVVDAIYAQSAVRAARLDVTGAWSSQGPWRANGQLGFDSLSVGDFALSQGVLSGGFGADGTGDFDVAADGPDGIEYMARGSVVADSLRTTITLEALDLSDDETAWRLAGQTRTTVEGSAIAFDNLRLEGTAAEDSPVPYIHVDGVLDRDGRSDLRVETRELDVRDMAALFQRSGLPSGAIDLDVELTGPAEAPEITAALVARDLALDGATLSELEGSLRYRNQMLEGELIGRRGDQLPLQVDGRVPADLSLVAVEERFPDRDMDLGISVDSLPAATVLGAIEAFQNVQGSLDGQVRFRGGRESLRPSGRITLSGGAFSLPGIGLNVRAAEGDFRLEEDFGVVVEAQLQAGGTATVAGTISLEDLLDPTFDLQVSAAGFQAVSRRDLIARVGGDVTLTGSYEAPRVQGAVRVQQGELYLEEFVRGAEVVDLTDPRFYDVVDTTLVAAAPGANGNPFLNNLRVDVDLSLDRDFWIRSRGGLQGMDVELAGGLTVNFDRPQRELVMAGTLQAIRGTYSQFGRQFEVQSGTLEFPGTPGMNPSLNIRADYRLRRREAGPLEIVANVGGTLQSPQVSLSSDSQPPIPESDLISYLLFGAPSFALQSNDASALVDLAVNTGLGGLGSSVGQSLGVDYLSISQSGSFSGLSAVASPSDWSQQFADTQIEMGRYIGQDVFIALTLRPLTGLAGPARRTQLPGARIEWSLNDFWSVEGFYENRVMGQALRGLGDLDAETQRAFGLSLFREWGY